MPGSRSAWPSIAVPGRPLVQRRSDGTWIRINERQTEDGGTVGVYTDITELKRREEELEQARDTAQQATEAKSRFLANMSHELRTPLNAIIGYSEMLQEEARDQSAEGFVPDLQRINAAGRHLLELINGVLDLSKIEAGKMELYLESFDIAAMVRDIAAMIAPLAQKNSNQLEVRCDETVGAMRADLTKVRQALFNLLSQRVQVHGPRHRLPVGGPARRPPTATGSPSR